MFYQCLLFQTKVINKEFERDILCDETRITGLIDSGTVMFVMVSVTSEMDRIAICVAYTTLFIARKF